MVYIGSIFHSALLDALIVECDGSQDIENI